MVYYVIARRGGSLADLSQSITVFLGWGGSHHLITISQLVFGLKVAKDVLSHANYIFGIMLNIVFKTDELYKIFIV